MECPACHHVNPAMAVRCLQCRTTLEHEGVGHSVLYRQGVRSVDTRILAGIGTIIGGFLGAMVASVVYDETLQELAYSQMRPFVFGGMVIGGLIGRLAAWWKNRWL